MTRTDLSADCANCVGLCCVALAFARSADFAFDKPAGDPCVNLDSDYRCEIHPQLRDRGFKGCTVFDCFGAGQKVSQVTFQGASWRDDPETRASMFATFPLVRRLHELLWYLDAAMRLPGADVAGLQAASTTIEALTLKTADEIGDVDARFDEVRPLLIAASAAARAQYPAAKPLGFDLLGADLAGRDLRGHDLRGRVLIAADLRGADLRDADLIGADLRDAKLARADLSTAIYLTQTQVSSALGDRDTKLPSTLRLPLHWL